MDTALIAIKLYFALLGTFLIVVWYADRTSDYRLNKKSKILSRGIIFLIFSVIFLLLALTGCTKTVYVPATAPQPAPIRPPVDYMQQLSLQSTPTQFVSACLAGRLDYKRAYEQCEQQLTIYAIPANLGE